VTRTAALGAAAYAAVAALAALVLALWRDYAVFRTVGFAFIVAGMLLAIAGGTGAAPPDERHWMHPALTRLIAGTALAGAGLFILLATVY